VGSPRVAPKGVISDDGAHGRHGPDLLSGPSSLAAAVVAIALGSSGCTDAHAIAVDTVTVQILAADWSWQASYRLAQPDGAAIEVPTGREIHVPLGAQVQLALASRDYICLFAMPDLGLRDFAAPGLPASFQFRADRAGSHELRGDELCGLPHLEKTRGQLLVEDPSPFRSWVRERARW
jgi:heme/copper-type cytochrome/quinol oxidase subunit 2